MNKLLTLSILSCLFLFSCGSVTNSSASGSSKAKEQSQMEQAVASDDQIAALYKDLRGEGNVTLKNLIYYLERPLRISNKQGFTLDGGGCTFIMKNKNEDVVIVEGSNNSTLKNFKATHIEPDGPIGCTGSVVQVNGCNGLLIEKCELNGSGIIGVMSYNTRNLTVADSYIYNNSRYGVLFDDNTSLTIRGNKFEDNGNSGNDHVAKALNASLSEVEKINASTKIPGLTMSKNTFE